MSHKRGKKQVRVRKNRLIRRALNRSLDAIRGFSARRFSRMGWGDGRVPVLSKGEPE